MRNQYQSRIVACLLLGISALAQPRSVYADSGRLFSLVARNASLRSTLYEIAKKAQISISVGDDVNGYVSTELYQVTIDAALRSVLRDRGYTYERDHGVIYVRRALNSTASPDGTAPVVLPLTVIDASRAQATMQSLFPQSTFRTDKSANALIVIASSSDLTQIRAVLQGIDVKNPSKRTLEATTLRTVKSQFIIERLKGLFPGAQLTAAGPQSLLINGSELERTQIKALIATLDTPAPTPTTSPSTVEVVRLGQGRPQTVARAVARQIPHVRIAVNGSELLLSGASDDVSRAKDLVTKLDVPDELSRSTEIRRLHSVDATSVTDLLRKSFPYGNFITNRETNSISITASVRDQLRISSAIAQLDADQSTSTASSISDNNGGFEVVTLRSALPLGSGGSSDPTATIATTLQQLFPALKILTLPMPGQLGLVGDPYTVQTAKGMLAKLDQPPPLVVLDTEIFEIDQAVANNLGLELPTPLISTTYSEFLGTDNGLTTGRIAKILPLTRTPLSLQAELNLLAQRGSGKILADPRITTLSGRTATIRAGDTLAILTTAGGGAGTYATTQLQTFQTGVTLDITPLVTPDNHITVLLHPVVNSLSGITNGVPQIATRDTETTVRLKNDETLVIGGLIQDSEQRTDTKIPFLGDIPLVGSLFHNRTHNSTRNQLVIVVTPHVISENRPTPPVRTDVTDTSSTSTAPTPFRTLSPSTQLPVPVALPPLPQPPAPMPLPSAPAMQPLENVDMNAPTRLPNMQMLVSGSATPNATSAATPLQPSLTPQTSPNPNAATPSSSSLPVGPQLNTYAYGLIPPSNNAGPTDAVRIYYATLTPSAISTSSTISVTAITTTNTAKTVITLGNTDTFLTENEPGKWTAKFSVPAHTLSPGQSTILATLTATRTDGANAVITMPMQIKPLPVGG